MNRTLEEAEAEISRLQCRELELLEKLEQQARDSRKSVLAAKTEANILRAAHLRSR